MKVKCIKDYPGFLAGQESYIAGDSDTINGVYFIDFPEHFNII